MTTIHRRFSLGLPVLLGLLAWTISTVAMAADTKLPPCEPNQPVPPHGCIQQNPGVPHPAPPPVADSPEVIKPPPTGDSDIVKPTPPTADKMPVVQPPTKPVAK
jgi:hypothetical protein